MTRVLCLFAAIVVGVSLGCSGAAGQKPGTDTPLSSTDEAKAAPAIANPASTHCLEVGGKLEIRTSPEGESGVCVFEDGTRCEEWRLLRGQCKKGECRSEDGLCGQDGVDP